MSHLRSLWIISEMLNHAAKYCTYQTSIKFLHNFKIDLSKVLLMFSLCPNYHFNFYLIHSTVPYIVLIIVFEQTCYFELNPIFYLFQPALGILYPSASKQLIDQIIFPFYFKTCSLDNRTNHVWTASSSKILLHLVKYTSPV